MSRLMEAMADVAEAIEAGLEGLLPPATGAQARLHAAMRYGTLGGGKRLRPFLVAAGGDLFDVPRERAYRVGCAIEMVHGYSLVHDDLPAMDDAALRRGRPTCHRKFDEATAILAGDALQTLAFEVLAGEATHPAAGVRLDLVRRLAIASGAAGMCGGQMIDLEAEGRALGLDEVLLLQRLKTGALIGFACGAGAVLAGADEPYARALESYAANLGLAFQIQDDLLDVTGDARVTGKDQGIDAAAGKATVVSLLGIAGARDKLAVLRADANRALDQLPGDPSQLRAVIDFVIDRAS
jgi:farnesyl diphosphate synthase